MPALRGLAVSCKQVGDDALAMLPLAVVMFACDDLTNLEQENPSQILANDAYVPRNATLLVNVSNVAWFGDSLAPAQHLQIARLRAIETGRMHLAATNTGITAAIDRDGRVLKRLPQFAEARLEIAAQGYSGATPYVRLHDWPIILGSLGILAIFIIRARLTR